MNDNVIYLEFNNWFGGRDYPLVDSISEMINRYKFINDEWCRKNKLCVVASVIDMSTNYCITAPLDWVQNNFPEVLTDGEYEYRTILTNREGTHEVIHKDKYNKFRRYPDEYGSVEGRYGSYFLDYEEYNFGVRWIPDEEYYDEDDEDDDK